jgi:hypothetical protein
MSKVQAAVDEFNKLYWQANFTKQPQDWCAAAMAGRRIALELGREGIAQDKLLDPKAKNEISEWAHEVLNEKIS